MEKMDKEYTWVPVLRSPDPNQSVCPRLILLRIPALAFQGGFCQSRGSSSSSDICSSSYSSSSESEEEQWTSSEPQSPELDMQRTPVLVPHSPSSDTFSSSSESEEEQWTVVPTAHPTKVTLRKRQTPSEPPTPEMPSCSHIPMKTVSAGPSKTTPEPKAPGKPSPFGGSSAPRWVKNLRAIMKLRNQQSGSGGRKRAAAPEGKPSGEPPAKKQK